MLTPCCDAGLIPGVVFTAFNAGLTSNGTWKNPHETEQRKNKNNILSPQGVWLKQKSVMWTCAQDGKTRSD